MTIKNDQSWDGVHADDYGWIGRLKIVRRIPQTRTYEAVDVSSYTALEFILKSPSGTVTTKSAVFDTDGTDGILKRLFLQGDITEWGTWKVQARIGKSGVRLTTKEVQFKVAEALDA